MNRREFLRSLASAAAVSVVPSALVAKAADISPPGLGTLIPALDDYEMGQFAHGTYTKIGKLVHLNFKVRVGETSLLVRGLPFAPKTGINTVGPTLHNGDDIFGTITYPTNS